MAGKLAPIAGQEELADMYEHVIEVSNLAINLPWFGMTTQVY
jgi:hypothetical protein